MKPEPLSGDVRRAMQSQRRKDTRPEVALRKALHAEGLRYRVNYKVPGAPRRTIDVAFPRAKVAVFVDGCFWHGCPEHCVAPKNNAAWWADKLAGNKRRDLETTALLEAAGWRVLRLWEHQSVDEMSALVRSLCQHQSLPTSDSEQGDS